MYRSGRGNVAISITLCRAPVLSLASEGRELANDMTQGLLPPASQALSLPYARLERIGGRTCLLRAQGNRPFIREFELKCIRRMACIPESCSRAFGY